MFYRSRFFTFAVYITTLAAGLTGCQGDPSAGGENDYSDFVTFYERFHSDSSFQMEHILFPLQGLPAAGDSTAVPGQPYFWKAEDWKIQGPFTEAGSDFIRTITPYGPDIMVEEFVHQSGEIGMLRRWTRLDSTWYLVYYAGLNPLSPK